jgi:hypothetical protein
VPAWVVGVGNGAVVGLAESAAGEDMCGGEAGGFFDAMEKENLVCWGYEKDTAMISLLLLLRWHGEAYLALGRGIGGVFGACLSGL